MSNEPKPVTSHDPEASEPRSVLMNTVLALLSLTAGGLVYFLMPAAMEEGARRMAAIFAFAVFLWITEAIPLFATSLGVIALESWWVALPTDLGAHMKYQVVFNSLSNPVIILFLGGFIMAKSVQKHHIDVQMAALMMRAFGTRPWAVLAGIMLVTAGFSMWMSNTATTAMMIIMVQPFVDTLGKRDQFRKALVLAVPFAANIGGIGTPIGTPPNAIALAQLQLSGISISFVSWMAFAVPLMLGALFLVWLLLLVLFRPGTERFEVTMEREFKATPEAMTVYLTFAVTVILWVTGAWHGIPTEVVAVLPATVLTVTRVISEKDFNRLEWNILMLIAGGIALGDGITSTGLDKWIVAALPAQGLSFFMLTALIGLIAIGLSTVISNSVAALILVPIGLALARGMGGTTLQLQVIATMCVIMTSFAMSLPISTPPNAIAYGTGEVRNRDMILAGGIIGVTASVVVILTGPFVIEGILTWLG
jgi:sodium-dependent dicarboxylate transporter 2/3/5